MSTRRRAAFRAEPEAQLLWLQVSCGLCSCHTCSYRQAAGGAIPQCRALSAWHTVSGKHFSPHRIRSNVLRFPIFTVDVYLILGARGGSVGWGTALQVGRSRVRFPMVSLEFFIDIILPALYFLRGKGGRYVGLTALPPSCADCLEIWEPQPTGTLWACSGL